MKRTWIVVYVASLLVGLALWRLAPARWALEFPQAILFGSALYFGALHRYTVRRTEGVGASRWAAQDGILFGLLARAALFLVFAGFQALACFEWMPAADVRGGFVISAAWLVSLNLIDARPGAKEARAV
jgi:hypothetical protein